MSTRFAPAGPLRGEAVAPADKSISHRVALVGAMSEDPLTVRNYLAAEDTHATLVAVQALGAGVEEHEDELVIRGVGLHTAHGVTGDRLDVGNSGTLMRLLPGWLAGQGTGVWTLDGDASIRTRPVDRVAEPLRRM
nr:3-phosphoshikimate 1-carboxyvinyltransferase [Thermoleophilaceae bacterium]